MNTPPELLNPEIWGPHYWFFLHTIAYSYPNDPNNVCKRKYYDLIHNFPLFIPNSVMGDKFAEMLDKYPVSPYLCSRDSFMKWVFFIHNKMNGSLSKPEMTYLESMDAYIKEYQPKPVILHERFKIKRKYIILAIIFICIFAILIYYK